jgi:hypothetical protein
LWAVERAWPTGTPVSVREGFRVDRPAVFDIRRSFRAISGPNIQHD